MSVNACDFGRSFLQFTTSGIHHTPRLQVEAICRFVEPTGAVAEYFLTASCISEKMYAPAGLVHQPPSEFLMIASREGEFMFLKNFATGRRDVREAHPVGGVMSTHDGRGARMEKIAIETPAFGRVRRIESYADIREAILGNRLLNARTSFLDADGRTRVELDYPVKVCNIPHDQERWQVDTGRIVLPAHPAGEGLRVERLAPAYIVFNAWDWADVAIRCQAPVDDGPATTAHYADIRRLAVHNEIYALA